MERIFISLLILFTSVNSSNILILPFTKRVDKSRLTNDNIFYKLENNILSVDIDIGNPTQSLSLVLSSDVYYTYIADTDSTSLSNIKTYNSNSSKDFLADSQRYKSSNDDFRNGNGADDRASFGEITDKSQRVNSKVFPFIIAREIPDTTSLNYGSGKIGLTVKNSYAVETYEGFNFIENLKMNEAIQNCVYFIDYSSSENGRVIFGALPYDYDSLHYQRNNFVSTKVYFRYNQNYKEDYWSFAINHIYYGNIKPEGRSFVMKTAQIKFDDGMLEGPRSIRNIIYDEFFGKYIKDGKCRERIVSQMLYYDCQKEGVDYQKMKSLYFINDLTENTFELKTNELFYDFNGRKYFLIRFRFSEDEETDDWILGEPFLRKYLMAFDFDNQQIYFQKTGIAEPKGTENGGIKGLSAGKIFLIIFIIILTILGVMFFIYKKSNKRANGMGLIDYYFLK
ncbi:MAG: A1 family peptidase [archaeon]|nr:A1 family peptidase [archaeon]